MSNLTRLLINKLVSQTKILNKIYTFKKPNLMDYHSHLTMKIGMDKSINFTAKFLHVRGKQACSHYLGYSIEELEKIWSFGKSYGLKKHPIYSIMTEESKKKCHRIGFKFPQFFELSGGTIDLGVSMSFPVNYIHKDGHLVPSFFVVKLNPFERTLKVKTIFNCMQDAQMKVGVN